MKIKDLKPLMVRYHNLESTEATADICQGCQRADVRTRPLRPSLSCRRLRIKAYQMQRTKFLVLLALASTAHSLVPVTPARACVSDVTRGRGAPCHRPGRPLAATKSADAAAAEDSTTTTGGSGAVDSDAVNPFDATASNFVAYPPLDSSMASPQSTIDCLVRKSDMRGQALIATAVKTRDALAAMLSGRMRKRDFVKSRWYRISRRVNPW